MRRGVIALVVGTAVLASACGRGKGELTRERAAGLLRRSPVFLDATAVATSPTATRRLLEVTGVRQDRGTAYVDFEYGLAVDAASEPTTKLRFGDTATFCLYDDGWRLDEGALRESLTHHIQPIWSTAPDSRAR